MEYFRKYGMEVVDLMYFHIHWSQAQVKSMLSDIKLIISMEKVLIHLYSQLIVVYLPLLLVLLNGLNLPHSPLL